MTLTLFAFIAEALGAIGVRDEASIPHCDLPEGFWENWFLFTLSLALMGAAYELWSDWQRLGEMTPKQFSLGYRFPSWFKSLPSDFVLLATVVSGLRKGFEHTLACTESPLDPDIGGTGVLVGLCVPVLHLAASMGESGLVKISCMVNAWRPLWAATSPSCLTRSGDRIAVFLGPSCTVLLRPTLEVLKIISACYFHHAMGV